MEVDISVILPPKCIALPQHSKVIQFPFPTQQTMRIIKKGI